MSHGATIQFYRGAEAGLPTLAAGEPGFTTDTYKLYIGDGATNHQIGGGTVTSVALAAPSNFGVSGSPVTGAGTLTFAWNVTTGRLLVGAGTSAMTELAPGSAGNYVRSDGSTWTANTIQAGDLPSHSHAAGDITSGTIATARLGSGTANSTTFLRGDQTWSAVTGATLADGDYGDITASSSGTVLTIDNGVVTFAKMQAISANVLLGNDASGTTVEEITCTAAGRALLDDADAEAQRNTLLLGTIATQSSGGVSITGGVITGAEIVCGQNKLKLYDTGNDHLLFFNVGEDFSADRTFSLILGNTNRTLTLGGNATLNGGTHSGTNTGDQTITLTGNVTGSGTGSFATTIASNAVADTMLRDSGACSVIGRSANSSGDPADITLGESELLARIGNVVDGYLISGFTLDDIALTDNLLFGDASASNETNRVTVDRLLGFVRPSLCEGRLTLTSGTPVTTSDVTGAGTLYLALHGGNRVCLYDGTRWALYTFTERSLSLTLTSGKNYDVFLYDNSGTLTLELSTAWTNDTTRADALTTQDGVYVKSGATTRRYLGTIRASGTNTTEDSLSKRFVWNVQNQVQRDMLRQDSTVTWTYTTNTLRQANAASANKVEYVQGLSDRPIEAEVHAAASSSVGGLTLRVGIGIDSTSTGSDQQHGGRAPAAGVTDSPIWCRYRGYPGVGYHALNWLEASEASGTTTWIGTAGTAPSELKIGISAVIWG